MNEGAARVYFIFAVKCKKSKMLDITWLNVVGVIPFITVAKSKIYCMGVKSMASGPFTPKAILLLPTDTFNFLELL